MEITRNVNKVSRTVQSQYEPHTHVQKHGIKYDKGDVLQNTAVAVATTSIAVNKLTAPSYYAHIQDIIQTALLATYETVARLENEKMAVFETATRKDGTKYIRPTKDVYKAVEKDIKAYIRAFALPVAIENPLMVYDTHAKQEGYNVAVAQWIIETSTLDSKDQQTAIELLDGIKALRHVGPSIRTRLRDAITARLETFYAYNEQLVAIDYTELEQLGLTILYT